MWKAFTALASVLALTACASMNQLSNDVSTYSLWPSGRQPTTYAFERLPSQQAHADQQQVLEDAAARALEQAGFKPAADAQSADVTVSLGARVTAQDRSPYDDPFWWRGGLYAHRFYGWPYRRYGFGPRFAYPGFYDSMTYEREVAMLIRDRKSGQPLYEVRVTNDGYSSSINSLLTAMFEAGLKDFPSAGGSNPRRVVTQISS
ncbi:MAG TPA: DUF4136 domain-containing protein [Albitalea sp.]|uniref:DUF4136 domain-containing protein n=1 Tax=Piscinibacter sp. TaxID=1903157 RepID=UPI002ED388E2